MRYLIAFVFIACGAHALDAKDTGDSVSSVGGEIFSDKKEQISAENSTVTRSLLRPRVLRQSIPLDAGAPIPAAILPNNVCIINTDLSPDRTIEEHIYACVRAHKIRQSITQ